MFRLCWTQIQFESRNSESILEEQFFFKAFEKSMVISTFLEKHWEK